MSLGFGVGDFIAAGEFTWRLYHDCFLIARGAPQEFRVLVDELKTLHVTMKLFEDEFQDPTSILVRAGKDRLRMVQDLLEQVKLVLKGLNEAFVKHRNLGNGSRNGVKRGWDQFKWAVGAKDVDGLRNKLSYLNGLLALLLTCARQSSLQRLEATTQSIDAGVQEIKTFLKRAQAGDLLLPVASALADADSMARIDFSRRCMEAAETAQRWTAISIEDWIKAGRWWLLNANMELRTARGAVPQQAYVDLLKASWILTDVIAVHPQLVYIESTVRYEVLHLTGAINEELRYIEARDLRIPCLDNGDDLEIWVSQSTNPTMRPGSVSGERTWVMKNEYIIFQKFAQYQVNHQKLPIRSLVLLLVDKESKQPRLVIHDQSWRCLAELAAESFNTFSHLGDNIVGLAGFRVIFPTTLDVNLLRVMLLAQQKYVDRYTQRFQGDYQATHHAIAVLVAIKLSAVEVIEYLCDTFSPPQGRTHCGPFILEVGAAAQHVLQKSQPDPVTEPFFPDDDRSLLFMMLARGFHRVAREMLKLWGLCPPDDDNDLLVWVSPFDAARKGRCDVLRVFLDEGISVDACFQTPDSQSARMLSLVAQCGNQAAALLLLDRGADVCAIDANGQTPLHKAASEGHVAVAELLLDRGSDISATDKDERSPLHMAALEGRDAMARLLLDRGTDISASDGKGDTSLHNAAESGAKATVQLLLDRGANLSAVSGSKITPLHRAASGGHEDVVRLLLDHGADICATDMKRETPLHKAAKSGDTATVQLLLDSNADVSAMCFSMMTALHVAATEGHVAIVRLLLDSGAEILASDCTGETPLYKAAESGSKAMVQLLLDRGADVLAVCYYKMTALHSAASGGHKEVVQLLLDSGADIDATGLHGRTPLHEPAKRGHETIVRLLLDRRADVSAIDNDWRTPLHEAVEWGHEAVAELLLDRGAEISATRNTGWTPLHFAAYRRHAAMIQLLLVRGADVSPTSRQGSTPLHEAAERGHEVVVKLLLDRGANASARDKNGETPMHRAVSGWGSLPVVQLLLDGGAGISAADKGGRTPLHLAVVVGRRAVVHFLLDKGADAAATDKRGSTPLQTATFYGYKAMVELLQRRE